MKKTRIAYVELGPGTFVELSDRPDGEMRSLEVRPVIAEGTLLRPAPPSADSVASQPSSLMTLTDVTSVEPGRWVGETAGPLPLGTRGLLAGPSNALNRATP